MKEGDLVALKTSFTRKIDGKTRSVLRVSAVGKITKDTIDGYDFSEEYGHLLPVEWINTEEREFIGYGGYRSTLNEVKNKNVINLVFMQGKETSNTPQESTEILDTDPRNYVFFWSTWNRENISNC